MAAVILLTWRLRPSLMLKSSQESGTDFRSLMGGTRCQIVGGDIGNARAGRLMPSFK